MELKEKMELLEDVFDLNEGELKPEMVLSEHSWWDSMAKLSLIVLIDDEFEKKLNGEEVRAMVTVQDIIEKMHK